jgi:hypothetical protein
MISVILGSFTAIVVIALIFIAWGANNRKRAKIKGNGRTDAPAPPRTGRASGPD